jgi:hypothetical protein
VAFTTVSGSLFHLLDTLNVNAYFLLFDFTGFWAPYKMKYIEKIESVQKRVTKQFPGMKNLSYPERLKKIGLPTLAYRRLRGDISLVT